MFVPQVIVQQVSVYVLATVINVLVQVRAIAVQQMPVYVLATVMCVLVLVQHIAVQQVPAYVLAIVMSVLVLAQHIAVQQVLLYAQIQLHHVTVLAVAQHLIVNHVLTLMVYADIQPVVAILVAMRMIMAARAQLVKLVAVAPVFLSRLALPATVAQPHIIGATARVLAQLQLTSFATRSPTSISPAICTARKPDTLGAREECTDPRTVQMALSIGLAALP